MEEPLFREVSVGLATKNLEVHRFFNRENVWKREKKAKFISFYKNFQIP